MILSLHMVAFPFLFSAYFTRERKGNSVCVYKQKFIAKIIELG